MNMKMVSVVFTFEVGPHERAYSARWYHRESPHYSAWAAATDAEKAAEWEVRVDRGGGHRTTVYTNQPPLKDTSAVIIWEWLKKEPLT